MICSYRQARQVHIIECSVQRIQWYDTLPSRSTNVRDLSGEIDDQTSDYIPLLHLLSPSPQRPGLGFQASRLLTAPIYGPRERQCACRVCRIRMMVRYSWTPAGVKKVRNHLDNLYVSPKGPDSVKAWKLGNSSRPTAKPTNEGRDGVSHLKFARKHEMRHVGTINTVLYMILTRSTE